LPLQLLVDNTFITYAKKGTKVRAKFMYY